MVDPMRGFGERGIALLAVLVILLVIAGSSASFMWFMNQQQTRAGAHLRSAAALAAAEAGVHRALSILESVAPDGAPGRAWRPVGHSETSTAGAFAGRFTLSLVEEADGGILITSAGEVAGITRRVRARVYLASPALLAALHGASLVRIEGPPAAMVILPYGAGAGERPWVHIAAGRGVGFGAANVAVNDPATTLKVGPGPVEVPETTIGPTTTSALGRVRLLLARGADLTIGPDHQRVDVQQLRVMGVRLEGSIVRAEAWPGPPKVDRVFFQTLAAANFSNAALHEAAGRYLGDEGLVRKRDSLYSGAQFEQLQGYLETGSRPSTFQGVIYVGGDVALFERQQMQIIDGALVAEGTLRLRPGASLDITHSPATRRLPGIVTLGDGALIVPHDARLRAHGLVYVSRTIDVWNRAQVDIVGALLGNDPALSFRSIGGTVVIRYDPAVLGTPGLRAPDGSPVVAWVAAWEEVP